jgi:hypothetical protein
MEMPELFSSVKMPAGTVIMFNPIPYTLLLDKDGYVKVVYRSSDVDRMVKGAVILKNIGLGGD